MFEHHDVTLRHALIATGGHVDHGKTSLVRALTGIDTDRLPEEKARGISITCGYAATTIGDHIISFVDVPGHERFIREMSGGAGGVDGMLLVVAADEGLMPQTYEHLEIAQFLGIPKLVVAITCCDRVDAAWAELVECDVRAALAATPWSRAAIVRCSALRGDGLDDLRVALVETVTQELDADHTRLAQRAFALPIDRVFSRSGHGTVVTGTVLAGRVEVGTHAHLVGTATRHEVRLRRLERHGAVVDSGGPGERLALNLAGIEQGDVRRGMWLTSDATAKADVVLDGWLTVSPRLLRPLKRGVAAIVQVGLGAAEARVYPFQAESLEAGATVAVELRLGMALPWVPGARFVVRGFERLPGAGLTWGGGTIVAGRDAALPRARRVRRGAFLNALAVGDVANALTDVLDDAGHHGVPMEALLATVGAARSVDLSALRGAIDARTDLVVVERQVYRISALAMFQHTLDSLLSSHHAAHPGDPGLLRSHLQASLHARGLRPACDDDNLERLLRYAEDSAWIRRQADIISLPSFTPSTTAPDELVFEGLAAILSETATTPPWRSDLRAEVERRTGQPAPTIERAVQRGLKEKRFVRVTPELIFDRQTLVQHATRLIERLEVQGSLTTGELKELLGATRKWLVPLLEWFDRERITMRQGETRVRHPSRRRPDSL